MAWIWDYDRAEGFFVRAMSNSIKQNTNPTSQGVLKKNGCGSEGREIDIRERFEKEQTLALPLTLQAITYEQNKANQARPLSNLSRPLVHSRGCECVMCFACICVFSRARTKTHKQTKGVSSRNQGWADRIHPTRALRLCWCLNQFRTDLTDVVNLDTSTGAVHRNSEQFLIV